MSERLPDFIDPVLFAEKRSILSGAIEITSLDRLSDLVAESDGCVEVEALFAKEGKRPVVSGSIKTSLTLTCQSCLQPLPWPLDIAFKLGVVSSLQEAEQLEVDCEPLLYQGGKVSFNALIEDEILLALPDYPKHGYDCLKRGSSKNNDFNDQNNPGKADNPFSVLAKLKKPGV